MKRTAKLFSFTLITLAVITGLAVAEYQPRYLPGLETFKATDEIEIDGELDDPGWRGLPRADNFAEHRPGDQTEPPVKTEAIITYDDKYLYVAFVCDDDPASIRANHCDRDRMWQDDNVILLLDTYGNSTWAYEIGVNPYGVQGDIIWSQNGGEDTSPDLIWESAGKITDSGYQVEMAIPFSSIRFPNKEEQVWKVDFWRNHPRDSRRQYSWAAYDRDIDCWCCQWGTVTGIKNIKPGKGIEFLPTLIGFQSGYLNDPDNLDYNWINEDIDGEASIGAKYAVSSNVTLEATYNPDFSQIESDVAQIDVNTTYALFFPEKRPFFMEGSDLFNTYISAVYTRSINNPIFASKLVGRMEKTSLAVLTAVDENTPLMIPLREKTILEPYGRTTSNIFRVHHTIGDRSHIGGLLTDRRYDGTGYNTVYGLDAAAYFQKIYNLKFQILASQTEEIDDPDLVDTTEADGYGQALIDGGTHTVALDGEKLRGYNLYAGFQRQGRNWWFDADYHEETPTFRADNGFVFMNGTRSAEIKTGYIFYYDTKIFDNIQPRAGIGRVWKYENGGFKDEWFWYELAAQLKGQTFIELGGLLSREEFGGKRFNDIYRYTAFADSKFSDFFQAGFFALYGNLIARREDPPIMAKESRFECWATIKPTDRLKISPSYNYFTNVSRDTDERLNDGFIFRTRLDYKFTRSLLCRLIVQYNDFNQDWEFDPLLTYRLSSFSVFYLGSSHLSHDFGKEDPSAGLKEVNRQFFMKLQYLLRI